MQTEPGGPTRAIPNSHSIRVTDDHELFSTALMVTLWAWGIHVRTVKLGGLTRSTSLKTLLHAICTVATGHPVMSEMERHSWLARHRRYHAEKQLIALQGRR